MLRRFVLNIPLIIPIASLLDMAVVSFASRGMSDSSLLLNFISLRFNPNMLWYFYSWAGYILIAIMLAILLCFFEKLSPRKTAAAITLNIIMSFLFLRHIIANI